MRTESLERRQFLTLSAASFAAALMPLRSRAQEVPAASFTFDNLVNDMRDLAQSSYAAPKPVKGFLADLDYDAYQRIRFPTRTGALAGKGRYL
ncbi:glucan biosynthesis protein [Sulfitobacter sp. W074]|uniref:glucan biosynthesis protein n=1 Tax=Sulfitobacter sp. W074 TaxID=2867026 RepID=UPI0021A6ED13|nr:glucan biosynthesis protein [Sulfitobacter sp. W074]